MRGFLDRGTIIFQLLEERAPFGIECLGACLEPRLQVFEITRIPPIEELAAGKGGIGFLTRHVG
jgi:hypothetical protein